MLYALGELVPQTAGDDYWTAPTAAVAAAFFRKFRLLDCMR